MDCERAWIFRFFFKTASNVGFEPKPSIVQKSAAVAIAALLISMFPLSAMAAPAEFGLPDIVSLSSDAGDDEDDDFARDDDDDDDESARGGDDDDDDDEGKSDRWKRGHWHSRHWKSRTPKLGESDDDRDRISDALEARMYRMRRGRTFEVVVTFDGSRQEMYRAKRTVRGLRVLRQFQLIKGFSARVTRRQAQQLARLPGVFRVEENFVISANLEEASEDFGSDYATLDFTVDGSGLAHGQPVGICIVDTGVDPEHEQLSNGKVAGFFDAVRGKTRPYDDHGHGTHVASIATGRGVGGPEAQNHQGVAPGAALYAAKALGRRGFGRESQAIAALEWCVSRSEVDVISMSIGTSRPSDGQDALSAAVNCATDPNWSPVCASPIGSPKVVVVAAGNAGPGPGTVSTPGAAEKAVTVGAVANPSGDGRGVYLAAFSGRGPTMDGRVKPDITAPGMRITAAEAGTSDGYVSASGTSMATPYVSGVVALMLDANPELRLSDPEKGTVPADRLREMLAATAQDRGPDGPTGGAADNEFGAGVIDAYAAVAQATGLLPGEYAPTQLPASLRVEGSVVKDGEWLSQVFEVSGDGTPLAAMLTIEGSPVCVFRYQFICKLIRTGWEWSPDLDMELVDAATGKPVTASNDDITHSECSYSGEFCGVGRQETIHYMPEGPGSYQFRVYAFSGSGDFALEVSGMSGGLEAVANAPETLEDTDNDGFETANLDGSESAAGNGAIVSYEWREGSDLIATGVSPSVSLAIGGHSIALTVTNDRGVTDTDVAFVEVVEGPPPIPNNPPVAEAGPDRAVADNDGDGFELVTLDASASSDPDGDSVRYEWWRDGAIVSTDVTVTLTVPVGVETITLWVSDPRRARDSDSVTVTVEANQIPVADAGPDQTHFDDDADGSQSFTLDASGSSDAGGGTIVSYLWSEAGITVGSTPTLRLTRDVGIRQFTLTVADEAGATASDQVVVVIEENPITTMAASGDIIVDEWDAAASVTGAWNVNTWAGGGRLWNGGYLWATGGTDSNSVSWTPALPRAGSYKVYARWPEAGNHTTDAKYRIQHDGGEAVVSVNQRMNGGQWVYLGVFPMTPDAGQGVVLRDDAPGVAAVDAVKFVFDPTSTGEVVVDELDAAATVAGGWSVGTWTGGGRLWNGSYLAANGGVGANSVTWTPALSQAGSYKVYARWPQSGSLSTDAKYRIQHDGGETVISVNQQLRGGQWVYLGLFAMTPDASQGVVLRDDGPDFTIADAVKFVLDPTGVGEVVVDELDPAATVVGPWNANSWSGGGRLWQGFYHWVNNRGTGANSATWAPALPQAGGYKVYARWPEARNHPTDAKYRIQHDGGEAVVSVNQQMNGGQWVYLGVYAMTPGAGQSVVLRDDAAGVTVADAVRLVAIQARPGS